MNRILVILLFLSFTSTILPAQEGISLQIKSEKDLPIAYPQKKIAVSEFEIQMGLRDYITQLNELGYLSASIDSLAGDSLHKTAYLFIGKKYEWTLLHTDAVDDEILSRTGFRDKQYVNKPFSAKQISRFFTDALSYLENTGYPFAEIKLNHVSIKSNQIEASVLLKKNQFYQIDSIQITGEHTHLNHHYIENVIRIKKSQPYDERVIRQISNRILEDPFMEELKPYEVIFTPKSCIVVLILKPKKANVFDGIIGFQPQPDNQGLILTGDVKIGLGNIVGQGEELNLRWQRLQDETQQIDAGLQIPFLFKTPFGIGYDLNIYRRDTTFNNVHHRFTVPFRLDNGSEFHGFFDNFSTSLISTFNYENATTIPPYNDAENKLYGIGYAGNFVENKYNPYSGWLISIDGGAGKNRLIRNAALELVDYDSIHLESTLLQGQLKLSYFQPITTQTTLLARINTAFKQSDNLTENQAFRMGGLLSLRGFDEQSIFASSYAIGTLEYRLLFDRNSRISVFYDFAWYELSSITGFITDTPQSFGAGISFGTNAGMFSLNYAIGSQMGNPLNFRTGKIHFGFVNLF